MCEQLLSRIVQLAISLVLPVTDWTTAITVILAALAVLLTALAIILGVAAIWGFTSIKNEAKKIAAEVANEAAEKKLIEYFETDALQDKIKSMMPAVSVVDATPEVAGTPYTEEEEVHNGNTNGHSA